METCCNNVGWCWIKFEIGLIFAATFLKLLASGQLLHNISKHDLTVECCNKSRWNVACVWRGLVVQCGSFNELNFKYSFKKLYDCYTTTNFVMDGHVAKAILWLFVCLIPDRCVECWEATSRSQWSSGKGTQFSEWYIYTALFIFSSIFTWLWR